MWAALVSFLPIEEETKSIRSSSATKLFGPTFSAGASSPSSFFAWMATAQSVHAMYLAEAFRLRRSV
ncbi:MAG: hypothetical protein EBT80_00515 [Chitinophagales bacterium]|nr:hypothetical protein [Chitinophagales bacterium]